MLTILGVAAVLAVVARLIFGRRLPGVPPWVTVLGFVLAGIGIVLAVYAFPKLIRSFEERSWPTVTGTVVESTVVGDRSFVPRIEYAYAVNGKEYTGADDRNVPLFGNKRRTHEVAEKESASFPVGSSVRVYYDPENPAEATIMPEPRWNDYFQSGLGVLLFGCGLFVLLWPRRGRRGG
jgi:hypothetical protein